MLRSFVKSNILLWFCVLLGLTSCQSRDERLKLYILRKFNKYSTVQKIPVLIEEIDILEITEKSQHEIDNYRIEMLRDLINGNNIRKDVLLEDKDWYERKIRSLKWDVKHGNVAWDATKVDDIADYSSNLLDLDTSLLKINKEIARQENEIIEIMNLSNSSQRAKNEYYLVEYKLIGKLNTENINDTVRFIVPKDFRLNWN